MNFKRIFFGTVLSFALFCVNSYSEVVNKVYVEGNKRISSETIIIFGDIGAGNFTKLANQIIVGANIHALSEALVLTTKAGLAPETVFNAIKGGLAGSNVMNAKAPMMFNRNFDPGFRIELHLKDITNAIQTANELNVPMQVTANLHQVLTSLVLNGKGKLDHSGILQFVEEQSTIEVKK